MRKSETLKKELSGKEPLRKEALKKGSPEKRAMCAFAAGLLSLLLLCACGSDRAAGKAPVTLIYGTLHPEQEMCAWIAEYNQAQEECRIEIREYENDGTEEGLERLNLELTRGEGPDLLDLSDLDAGPYISKGLLTDLYPLLDGDPETAREDFVPGILKLYESDGHLYGVAPGYRLETIMGRKAVLGEPSEWTAEKMSNVISGLPEGSCLVNNLGAMGLLRIVLQRGMGEFADWSAGTCSFDSDRFRELLRLAARMDALPVFDDDERAIADGNALANRLYLTAPEEYAASARLFPGEDVVCVGFPSPRGGGADVSPYLPVGICRGADENAAWGFVKSLLGEEFQEKHIRFNFPLREDSLEKLFAGSIARSAPDDTKEGAGRTEMSAGQTEISAGQATGDAAEAGGGISRTECDALYEVINGADCSQVFDAQIWNIVSEEAAGYFAGEKTLEQVAGVIQSRASIYMQENYG